MTSTQPARTPTAHRSTRLAIAAALLGGAALLAATLGGREVAAAPAAQAQGPTPPTSTPRHASSAPASRPTPQGPIGEADGLVPDGATVFDSGLPAIANLDPALRRAVQRAATDAARDGVTLYVDSGWRDARYQQALLQRAISQYGSPAEAARWVATPATSPHVTGEAIDIGRADADAWLSRHGAAYGLCQIYRNEPWHYELRPQAVAQGCPPEYADPTRDPRLQQ